MNDSKELGKLMKEHPIIIVEAYDIFPDSFWHANAVTAYVIEHTIFEVFTDVYAVRQFLIL